MNVYIIWEHVEHEGSSLLGIYRVEKDAIKEAERIVGKSNRCTRMSQTYWRGSCDSIEVEEHEVK